MLAFSIYSFESIFAGFFYLIVYLLSTFSIFYAFIIIKPKQLNSSSLQEFNCFTGLKLINPVYIIILGINFLSLAGIPPLSGFLSKFLILVSLIEINYLKLVLFLIIVSLIAAYYYIRIIKILVFSNKKFLKFFVEIPYNSGIILILIFFFNFFLMLQPNIFFSLLENILFHDFFIL